MAETIIPTASELKSGAAVDDLKASGDRILADAKAKVADAAESQRRRAADAVRGMAGALHRAAGDLKPENEAMGRYTDMAAERLDQFAGYLRGANWADMLGEAEDMARRQPAWFIGGAMAAGFVVARLIKNSGEAGRRREDYARRASRRLAPAATAGYGTGAEAGVYPAGSAAAQAASSPSGARES